MPFTPSHAVVALPFVRTPLVPAAIAVGAMTPDLPLFLRGTPITYPVTHDPRWIPATILLALVLLLVWRCVLRPAVRELSPRWLAARIPASWDGGVADGWAETLRPSWRSVLLLLASLALGVASHIAWDAFTHEGRIGVELVPALDEQWGPLLGLKWVQHGSSALGLLILAIAGWLWVRRQHPVRVDRLLTGAVRVAAWVSLPVVLVVGWLGGLALYGPLTSEFTVAHLAYRVLPPACAIWALLLVALCVLVQIRRAIRAPRTASPAE
ncbi:DUF4184 family protein [Microbacterium sp. cx-55]|uniref:DUF4184 family protein n=1 Tax=Microbacterium sp. cx-55 TaxID=2875948 RepID=UPI001CBC5F18|nr:DUF4184 family protein [Microbacterium sp. cx-55]MBZ4488665.1 DUF4184 family protein [Microbacterium sp. cx-55]UGB36239.1 DUF4184 family protein [Microbacterium sp. cx-55]